MRKYTPVGDRIVIKILPAPELTKGSIILVSDTMNKENLAREEGKVLSMGASIFGEAYDDFRKVVKVGDTIAFPRYGGKHLGKDEDGNEIRVIRDVDILCVIEEE